MGGSIVGGSAGGNVASGDQTVGAPLTAALDAALRPLAEAIRAAPADKQGEAEAKLAALKQEAAKGKGADDSALAKLVDGLVKLVPAAVSAVVSAFALPILGGVAGPVTKFALSTPTAFWISRTFRAVRWRFQGSLAT